MASGIVNVLTIDVEDYFMVSAFESLARRETWGNYESRIERNTHHLLGILDSSPRNSEPAIRRPVRATFFCLGWIAKRYPHLIKEIHKMGHEIGCHSFDHQLVYHMKPAQFREDIRKTKMILEDAIGAEVIGYRAPSYSITRNSLWAIHILAEEGYRYDSSIFPVYHDRYGIPNAPRYPFLFDLNGGKDLRFLPLEGPNALFSRTGSLSGFRPSGDSSGSSLCASLFCGWDPSAIASNGLWPESLKKNKDRFLVEFPITTTRLCRINVPIAGGGYFRLFPYAFLHKAVKAINEKEKRPAIFYLHPWEFDPTQPRFQNASPFSKFRHYLNLDKTEGRFRRLLSDFAFSSIRESLKGILS